MGVGQMSSIDKNKYSDMQRAYYAERANNWSPETDSIVGSFDQQNTHKDEYYNNLFGIIDTTSLTALEFACGPARNIQNYRDRFKRIDGVDFEAVASIASGRVGSNYEGKIYNTLGFNLSEPDLIPSDTYDIVYSMIAFQHICVHEIRLNYLKEFFRVLKPGGSISIQMGYGPGGPGSVDYYSNEYDVKTTNGNADTRVENPEQLRKDIEDIVGFTNFKYQVKPLPWYHLTHPEWIYFQAIKPSTD